jgi:EAL domain-containing protein (putative c-di-GMP-specific phosphodiesterase class I)/ABC-type amino acid transport substrate-binding protein/GGDEF domain-containing protein
LRVADRIDAGAPGQGREARPAGRVASVVLLTLLALLPVATGVAGADASGALVMGGDRQYPPMHYTDSRGSPAGFDIELFGAVAAEAGLDVSYRLADWSTTLDLLEAGDIDVVPMFVSAARARRFLFSSPYLRRYHVVFGRKGSAFVPSLEDLAGRRVAVQYAGLAWETLTAFSSPIAIIPVDVESEAVATVARGDADYALVPMMVGYHALLQHRLQDVVVLSPPMLEAGYAFAVSPRRPDLVPLLDAALNRVGAIGEQDRLYMKWLANLQPPDESFRSGLATAALATLPLLLATLLLVGYWRRARAHALVQAKRAENEVRLRMDLEARARYLAFHDPATDLPNRNALEGVLAVALQRAEVAGAGCAVMRVNLIGLDMVRTLAGPGFSTQVAVEAGARLGHIFGSQAIFSVGRGEFAVVAEGPDVASSLQTLMRQVVDGVGRRMHLDELTIEQRCRVGLALYPQHGVDVESMLRAAEMACAAAHEKNQTMHAYDGSLEPDPRNLHLLSDLHDAIEQRSLQYVLQPKLDLGTRRIVGAELLARWTHPRFGEVPPNLFIPLAEKTGLIGELTRHYVRCALVHLADWRREGLHLTLSVNVSVNDLADAALIDDIVDNSGDLGHLLVLEITETDVMRDSARVLAAVARLRQSGIRISLDDFGTGWSSLTYLRQMAPDELKIDRSFITDLVASRSDQAIVRAIIQLAHHLGATVTAEGIEDDATLEWLRRAGCDTAQGYSIGRPMDMEELLQSTRRHTGTNG